MFPNVVLCKVFLARVQDVLDPQIRPTRQPQREDPGTIVFAQHCKLQMCWRFQNNTFFIIRRPSGVWEWNRPRHSLLNHEIYRQSWSDMSSETEHHRKPSRKPFRSSRSSIWGGVSRPQFTPGGGGILSDPPPFQARINAGKLLQISQDSSPKSIAKSLQNKLSRSSANAMQIWRLFCRKNTWRVSANAFIWLFRTFETTVFYSSFKHLTMLSSDSHNARHWHENLCSRPYVRSRNYWNCVKNQCPKSS